MKFSFLATGFSILALLLSGFLSSVSIEVGVLSACFLLGAATDGPPSQLPPDRLHSL